MDVSARGTGFGLIAVSVTRFGLTMVFGRAEAGDLHRAVELILKAVGNSNDVVAL